MNDATATKPTREALIKQLLDLTKSWNQYDLVPDDQRAKCIKIGAALNELGDMPLMQDAYYDAKDANRYCGVIAAYWDKIGEWRR